MCSTGSDTVGDVDIVFNLLLKTVQDLRPLLYFVVMCVRLVSVLLYCRILRDILEI
jgi:hypothetical protein